MNLNDARLSLENVVADPSKSTVQVVGARPDVDRDQKIIGYRLTILTCKYSRNPVKLPATPENKVLVDQLNGMFRTLDSVEVLLTNPVVRAYALLANGNLLSGISIKADTFVIAPDEEEIL